MQGYIDVEINDFFEVNNYNRTRGHDLKLSKPKCYNNVRSFSFGCRNIDTWNNLPACAVNAESVNIFKSRINAEDSTKYLHVTT